MLLEQQAAKIKLKILEMARDENVDSDALILAISDVIGITAVACDRFSGVQPIDGRLQAVVARAKQTYGRMVIGL